MFADKAYSPYGVFFMAVTILCVLSGAIILDRFMHPAHHIQLGVRVSNRLSFYDVYDIVDFLSIGNLLL